MTYRDFLTLVNSWWVEPSLTEVHSAYDYPFRTTGINDMRTVVTDVPDNSRHSHEYKESDLDTFLDILAEYAKSHKSEENQTDSCDKPEVSIRNVWFVVPSVTVLWSDGTYTTVEDKSMTCAAAEPVVDTKRDTVTYSAETDSGFEVFTVSLSEWKRSMFARALVTKMCSSYESLVDKWC